VPKGFCTISTHCCKWKSDASDKGLVNNAVLPRGQIGYFNARVTERSLGVVRWVESRRRHGLKVEPATRRQRNELWRALSLGLGFNLGCGRGCGWLGCGLGVGLASVTASPLPWLLPAKRAIRLVVSDVLSIICLSDAMNASAC